MTEKLGLPKNKITSSLPMTGLVDFAKALAQGEMSKNNINTVLESDIIIDTCVPSDTGIWETGVKRKGEAWIIVSQYHNDSDAISGHQHWVEALTENPSLELEDINLWNL